MSNPEIMSTNSVFPTPEVFSFYKNEADKLMKKDTPNLIADIDEGLIPIIRYLNSFPYIATLFCCEGHKPGDSLYIASCINDYQGLAVIGEVYSCLDKHIRDYLNVPSEHGAFVEQEGPHAPFDITWPISFQDDPNVKHAPYFYYPAVSFHINQEAATLGEFISNRDSALQKARVELGCRF